MLTPSLKSGYQGYFNPRQVVTIAAGQTDSDVFQGNGFVLAGIILPSIFTGTSLSFLVGDSTVGFQANGQVSLDTNPANLDTLTINGTVITFVTAPPTGNQVLIGADVAATAVALQAFLDATADVGLLACTYVTVATVLFVTAIVHGTAGNAYTFAKSSSHITLTPSGGVLSGGGFRPLYDSSNSLVSMTVAQGRCYAVDPANFQGVSYLKIKSGSTENAQRTLICSLKGF